MGNGETFSHLSALDRNAHEANCVETPMETGEISLNFNVLLRFKVNPSTQSAP